VTISLLTPTRERPDNIKRMVDSARSTSDNEVEFIFYVDEDDRASADMIWKLDCTVVLGPRIVLSEMWNKCYEYSNSEINMHCGDDIVFRTAHWDSQVKAEFAKVPDKIVLVHGEDGIQGEALATHSFLHRNWTEALGYFVPPYFSSDFNDTWLTDLAVRIGRKVFLPDLYTEHMHPCAGKGTWDKTHQERLVRHWADDVTGKYESMQRDRELDAEKLREFIAAF
jgi:hypothetical protein